jgi:NAD(P)-dependent dehydrogenase (short-subunit alcohol dehydrogenase family)
MKPFDGKVALVTGGGQGLGQAICKTLCSKGVTVVLADIRMDLAEKTAAELEAAGNKGMPVKLDVSEERQVQETISKIVGEYGRLDVLINNAGTDKTLSIEELSIQDWDRVLSVNLRGPFLTSKAVLPIMRQQGSGHIINIASTAAKRAWANASAYHASKWGLLGFSHALHVEARPHNVKVTALIAGGMRTPFLLDRFPDINVETLQDPKNVAEVIAFLLTMPDETVIPELMVIPMRESSWP